MITRRQWLAGTGALGVGAMVGGGCGDPGAITAVVLEVESTRALVSVWSLSAHRADVVVTTTAGASTGGHSLAFDRDRHGVVDVIDLMPGTAYQVRVVTDDGATHGPLSFTTAPADDDRRPIRIAVSADVDESSDYLSPIFDTMVDLAPDLFVSLGDWPYSDNGPSAFTRAEYEAKNIASHFDPRVAQWLRSTSFRAIYDDHEFANDWDGAARELDPDRHQAALATWDAWFPHRGDGPRYRRWRWGGLCECFLLDCRAYRSPNDQPDGPGKTMLGPEQRRWLVDGLRNSTAPFRLVFSSVPLDFGHGDDHWASFLDERDAILDELAAAAIPGLLFISGDQHWFAAHRHRHGIREFQVGPLARGVIPMTPLRDGILFHAGEYNLGLIEITAEPRLRFRAIGATGATIYEELLTPTDLTPTATAR